MCLIVLLDMFRVLFYIQLIDTPNIEHVQRSTQKELNNLNVEKTVH